MTRKTAQADALSGDLLAPVTLTAHELASLRHASDLFREIRCLISDAIVPALGGSSHPINIRLNDLLSEVTLHSGNFCYRHWKCSEERAREQWMKGREVSHVSR